MDFDTLNKTIGVDVTGKICIAKYGRVFRGDKVLLPSIITRAF